MRKIVLLSVWPRASRGPLLRQLGALADIDLHILYCSRRDPVTALAAFVAAAPPAEVTYSVLPERWLHLRGRALHHDPAVFARLRQLAPDVLVLDDCHPTQLYAALWARLQRRALVWLEDGLRADETAQAHASVSPLSTLFGGLFARQAQACIATSDAALARLYAAGVSPAHCHRIHPGSDPQAFRMLGPAPPRSHDLLVYGDLTPAGNPLFALNVAAAAARRLGRPLDIAFAGSGAQAMLLEEEAARLAPLVRATFLAAPDPAGRARLLASAGLLLAPAAHIDEGLLMDARAAALPVLAPPAAQTAGLLRHAASGYALPLRLDAWALHAARILGIPALRRRLAREARRQAQAGSPARAAREIRHICVAAEARAAGAQFTTGKRRHVLVVERQLLHYRVPLYQRLRDLLQRRGIDLTLLYGDGTPAERQKQDESTLDWSIRIPTRYFMREKVCWQPFGDYARAADLVIVMHENKLLYNLWLLSLGRPRRLAFWGHGRNMQSAAPGGWKERFKRWTINKVDWWFAYTDGSAALVHAAHFPRSRTTVVENAIDTREMIRLCDAIGPQERARLRATLGLGDGPVGLFLGSLYAEKRLDFLLAAAQRIRAQLPGFHLLIVGAGPQRPHIEAAAAAHPWIHYLGQRQGRAKAEALALADVMLNPGLVGLGVLDAFAGGVPLFTTDCGLHSPEIDYLASGENGMIIEDDVALYARVVADVLADPARLQALRRGARAAASRYTVENMAERICSGIVRCLERT